MIVCHHAVYNGTCDCDNKQLSASVIVPETTAPAKSPEPIVQAKPPEPAAPVIQSKPAVAVIQPQPGANLEVIPEGDDYDDDNGDSYDSGEEYGLDCNTPSYDCDPDA